MNNNGVSKFQEVGQKLKDEAAEKAEKTVAVKEEVKNQLAAIQGNEALAHMYNENAAVGAENLSGNAPYLKVHAAGKSTTNILADGTKPNDGYFFYKPTGEQFETVSCHILTISKGFKAAGMNNELGEAKQTFNQILGGVIKDNGEYKPFVMFFSGVKLSPMWDFGKEASRYTKAKPVSIPMFALTVTLRTEEIKTKFGLSWVVKFEIEKEENGFPKLILDPGEFQFIRDNVETTEELIASLIAAKTAGDVIEDTGAPTVQEIQGEAIDAQMEGFTDSPL